MLPYSHLLTLVAVACSYPSSLRERVTFGNPSALYRWIGVSPGEHPAVGASRFSHAGFLASPTKGGGPHVGMDHTMAKNGLEWFIMVFNGEYCNGF